jgi:hypothetical protein
MKTAAIFAGIILWFSVPLGAQVPDFVLPDVNSHSSRSNQMVSPRDYILQVSGYYFGTAG